MATGDNVLLEFELLFRRCHRSIVELNIYTMRTILLFFYTLSMATVSAFLVLDKIVVYPTTDMAVRITLNVTLALFILALITGAYFRWKWSRLAGVIFLSMVLVIDAIGSIFNGISLHWPGLAVSIVGLPYLMHWLIVNKTTAETKR